MFVILHDRVIIPPNQHPDQAIRFSIYRTLYNVQCENWLDNAAPHQKLCTAQGYRQHLPTQCYHQHRPTETLSKDSRNQLEIENPSFPPESKIATSI
jgi:hypothetical protein